uniref:Uncharacterized protein n=1 Tax=Romanomermis culicivorax TaxID=13658 RepID=A0A915JKF8_ROMCU
MVGTLVTICCFVHVARSVPTYLGYAGPYRGPMKMVAHGASLSDTSRLTQPPLATAPVKALPKPTKAPVRPLPPKDTEPPKKLPSTVKSVDEPKKQRTTSKAVEDLKKQPTIVKMSTIKVQAVLGAKPTTTFPPKAADYKRPQPDGYLGRPTLPTGYAGYVAP